MTEPTFDLEKQYDAEVVPLMEAVFEACKRLGLPIVASITYSNSQNNYGAGSWAAGRDGWAPLSFAMVRNLIEHGTESFVEKFLKAQPNFLIWSHEHQGYWRPARRGYTQNRAEAGRYNLLEALGICADTNEHCGQFPNETMVRDWRNND